MKTESCNALVSPHKRPVVRSIAVFVEITIMRTTGRASHVNYMGWVMSTYFSHHRRTIPGHIAATVHIELSITWRIQVAPRVLEFDEINALWQYHMAIMMTLTGMVRLMHRRPNTFYSNNFAANIFLPRQLLISVLFEENSGSVFEYRRDDLNVLSVAIM